MATKKITMVDAMQIVRKGYKGCASTAAVKSFCRKNHVECCWWTPQNGKRTMLIEITSFQNAYRTNRTANSNRRTSSSRGNSNWAKSAKVTRRGQSSWAKNTKRRTKRTTARKTRTYARARATGRRLRRAA